MPVSHAPGTPIDDLLAMAASIRRNIPLPVAFANDEGDSITLDGLLKAITPDLTECQREVGSDDVCGLQVDDSIHDPANPNGHVYIARVVQSEERLPRKQEVAGSIPVSSSKSIEPQQLTGPELNLVNDISRELSLCRDNKKFALEKSVALKKLNLDHLKTKLQMEAEITTYQAQADYHGQRMRSAEIALHESIISKKIILAPEPVVEVENPELSGDCQLGRDE